MSRLRPAVLDGSGKDNGRGFGDSLMPWLETGLEGPSITSRISSRLGGEIEDAGLSEGERATMTMAFSELNGSFC